MSEEAKPKEKKWTEWTEWSVVSTRDGTLRCRRANVKDEKDAEYMDVPRPVFSPDEIAGMIGFGKFELLESDRIADLCYERRYRSLAFSLCAQLNTSVSGAGK